MKSFYLFVLLVFDAVMNCEMADPIVTIKEGQLKGAELQLLDGSPYYSFKGIPYGHVGARFAPPEPPLAWQGVRDATQHGPVCPQYDLSTEKYEEGNENCLFINVYTKSLKAKAKLPVMVFIHGGSFMSGNGNSEYGFGGDFLVQHNVILCTINYRLEAHGFLSLDIPGATGNAGLKDQVAALKWVKKNIAKFGGDPDNVTLFGESSGAGGVTDHLQSPMSKGLFHKAIAQSGVNLNEWAIGRDAKERAFRAAKFLGNDTRDPVKALEFLRSVPPLKLARITYNTMTEDETHRGLPVHFTGVIEKRFKGIEPFMTEEPITALVNGRMNKVPLLMGYNSDEAIIMLQDAMTKLDFTNKNPKYLVQREVANKLTEEKMIEVGKEIKEFYIGKRDFTAEDNKPLSDMLTDTHFLYGINRFAHYYSQIAPTYFYKFQLDTELNLVKLFSSYSNMTGACHADDLFYLFYSPINKDAYNSNAKLKDVVFKLTKLWADFAKSSNPTPGNTFEAKWTPYTTSCRSYLDINNSKYFVGKDADKRRVDFWDKMYCDAGLPCINKKI